MSCTSIPSVALASVLAVGWGEVYAQDLPPDQVALKYPFFINDDGFLFLNYGTNRVMDPAHIEASRNAPECQPVEMDPSGNWGYPNDGRQFSIRFEKSFYARGEPINVHFLVRNVADTNVSYYIFGAPGALFQFIVTDERGQEVETIQDRRTTDSFAKRLSKEVVNSPKLAIVAPETQRKNTVEFHRFYDLEPGTYFVSAWVRYPDYGNLSRRPEIRTANAVLRITDSKSIPPGAKQSAADGTRIDSKPEISTALGAGQSVEVSGRSSSTGTNSESTDATVHTPGDYPQSDSLPTSNEASGTHLGVASGSLRFGASVLALLLASAVVFVIIRRARRHS